MAEEMSETITVHLTPKWQDGRTERGMPLVLPVLPRVGDFISNQINRTGSENQKSEGSGTHDFEVLEVVFECLDGGEMGNEPEFQRINLICLPIERETSSKQHIDAVDAAKQ